jgi:hypothetical protein
MERRGNKQDGWFWIPNNDWRSKRRLSLFLFLFTLAADNGNTRLPVLTIPAR